MPRTAAQRLLSMAVRSAAAHPSALPAFSTQPVASIWTAARGSGHASGSCTCSACAATGQSHQRGCRCGSCWGGAAPTLASGFAQACMPSGRSGFATLDGSQSQLDAINDRFSEAREEISIAQDDAETTYFNESHAEAKKVTEEALKMYADLLESLDESERGKLQRSMGLKMEQLKAELGQLDTLHD